MDGWVERCREKEMDGWVDRWMKGWSSRIGGWMGE